MLKIGIFQYIMHFSVNIEIRFLQKVEISSITLYLFSTHMELLTLCRGHLVITHGMTT